MFYAHYRISFIVMSMWLALTSLALAAEEPITITATSSRQEMLIGDTLHYTVTIQWQKDIELKKIEPGATIGVFEIQDVQASEQKTLKNGLYEKSYTYVLSTFDTGEFEIPPFTVEYQTASGDVKTAQSQPITITVKQVPHTSADRNDVRDIKPPLSIPANTRIRNILLASVAGLLVLGALGGFLLRRRLLSRRAAADQEWIPPKPIEELAYDDLNALAQSSLLAERKIKEYHIRLSEIVRIYLGRRYKIAAIDMTSYELISRLKECVANESTHRAIEEFLDHCDLVKFAKYVPEHAQCVAKLEQAKMIVEQTTPRPIVSIDAEQGGTPSADIESQETDQPEKEVTV